VSVSRPVTTILLVLLVLLGSCTDDPPTGNKDGKGNVDFPNAIGMLWKYQVYDSLTQITDTVWLSLTDTLTSGSNGFVTRRSEKHVRAGLFDWQYLHFRGDTLEILDSVDASSAGETVVFPLDLGSSWQGPVSADDTSVVTLVGRIDVPAGPFNDGARIDRSWNLDFEGGGNWSQTWLVPDIGMVYRYCLSQFSDGSSVTATKNEVWELIGYDLTTFTLRRFPNKVGTEWVYEEIDSTSMGGDSVAVTFDTVTVTIADSGHFESGTAYTLWEFRSHREIDTQFVVTAEERITFQQDTISSPLWDLYYNFPLAVGRTWGIYFIAPFAEVLDKERVVTPVQTFPSCFHARMYGGGFNDYWHQDDWLVRDVGIVKSVRRQFGFWPEMTRTRTLVDYYVVP